MNPTDLYRPSTWAKYRARLCEGCWAGCCTLPVEVQVSDLLRIGLVEPDEIMGSLKKVARRLIHEGIVRSFRAGTGLFTLEQKNGRDCVFLGSDRRCTIYDRRPDTCRNFPRIGPRPDHCPAGPK